MIDKAIEEGRKLTTKLLESPMSSVATLLSFVLVFVTIWIGSRIGHDLIREMQVVSGHENQRIANDAKGLEVIDRFAAAVDTLNRDEQTRHTQTVEVVREYQSMARQRAENLRTLQKSIDMQNNLLERIYAKLDK